MKKNPNRNLNFRQTPREFRSALQAKIWGRVKRNIPYAIHTSKEQFNRFADKFRSTLKKSPNKHDPI